MKITKMTFETQIKIREGLDFNKYEMFIVYDRTPEVVTEKKDKVVLKKDDAEFWLILAGQEDFNLCECRSGYSYFSTPEKAMGKAFENWGDRFCPMTMTLVHKVHSGEEKIDGTGHGYLRRKRKIFGRTKTSYYERTGHRWG